MVGTAQKALPVIRAYPRHTPCPQWLIATTGTAVICFGAPLTMIWRWRGRWHVLPLRGIPFEMSGTGQVTAEEMALHSRHLPPWHRRV